MVCLGIHSFHNWSIVIISIGFTHNWVVDQSKLSPVPLVFFSIHASKRDAISGVMWFFQSSTSPFRMKLSSLVWTKSGPFFFAIMGSRLTEGFLFIFLKLRWSASLLTSNSVSVLPKKAAIFFIANSRSCKENYYTIVLRS